MLPFGIHPDIENEDPVSTACISEKVRIRMGTPPYPSSMATPLDRSWRWRRAQLLAPLGTSPRDPLFGPEV